MLPSGKTSKTSCKVGAYYVDRPCEAVRSRSRDTKGRDLLWCHKVSRSLTLNGCNISGQVGEQQITELRCYMRLCDNMHINQWGWPKHMDKGSGSCSGTLVNLKVAGLNLDPGQVKPMTLMVESNQ